CPTLIPYLLEKLEAFSGAGRPQEDDVTLVTLHRTGSEEAAHLEGEHQNGPAEIRRSGGHSGTILASFSVPSEAGAEREVMRRVIEAVAFLALPRPQVERLKTAVAETAMNAIEHGNKYQASLPVDVEVLLSEHQVIVRISDQGGGTPIPAPQVPDLKAK